MGNLPSSTFASCFLLKPTEPSHSMKGMPAYLAAKSFSNRLALSWRTKKRNWPFACVTSTAVEVVAFLKKFDGEVEGKFSGLIPLSNRDGAWDYVGGYLELNPGTPGRLRYRSDGILTSDVKPGSAEFKRLRQVELALKDLDVKRLRLDFLMEDGQTAHHGRCSREIADRQKNLHKPRLPSQDSCRIR